MKVACTLLAESERRYLLYQLADDECATIEGLIDQIAAWEEGVPEDEVPKGTRQTLYISLVHNHLPRLADYEIVDYDLRSGDVVLAEGFEDVKPILEQFKQTEEVPEIRERPPL